MKNNALVVSIIPAIFLFGALIDGLPYGYFRLLRIVVCIASVAMVVYSNNVIIKYEWISWLFIGMAILFNPILPVYLSRSTWIVIDFIAGAIFIACGFLFNKLKKEKGSNDSD
jgi:hypothetical protein